MEDWVIFYKNTCMYSIEALKLFKKTNIKVSQFEISNSKEKMISLLIKNKLLKNKSNYTVPIIFYKKKYIGGCKELKKLLQ